MHECKSTPTPCAWRDFGLSRFGCRIREAPALPRKAVTSALVAALRLRVTVGPSEANGLQNHSRTIVNKAMTVKRDKAGPPFGRIDADALVQVEPHFAVFQGFAK